MLNQENRFAKSDVLGICIKLLGISYFIMVFIYIPSFCISLSMPSKVHTKEIGLPAALASDTKQADSDTACRKACSEITKFLDEERFKPAVNKLFDGQKPVRTIPTFYQFMQMDQLGTEPSSSRERWHQVLCCPPDLIEVRKDKDGNLWGLIESFILGHDSWLAKHDGKRWTDLWYIGTSNVYDKSWNDSFIKESEISKDNDADGWTDLVEKRIGTNPLIPDTDGDGLKDSEDKNPLAAPRKLNETEQIIVSALNCFFKYKSLIQIEAGAFEGYGSKSNSYIGIKDPVLVELPDGLEPFEIPGATWITVTAKKGTHVPLSSPGSMILRFPPWLESIDVMHDSVHTVLKKTFMLWNKDHTEVLLNLEEYHGERAGRWYDVTLQKINGQWIVINIKHTLIS